MECSICLEQSQCLVVSLECKHTFHASCIAKWLLRSRTCPLCRQAAPESAEEVEQSNRDHQIQQERMFRIEIDSAYTNLICLIAVCSILSMLFKPVIHALFLSLALFFRNYRLLVLLLPGKWFLISILLLCAFEIKQQLFS